MITFEITTPLRDVSNAHDGTRLMAVIEVNGVPHHWDLIAVVEDENGLQKPADPELQGLYDDLQRLYSARRYETICVDGFPWNYVDYLHPYG